MPANLKIFLSLALIAYAAVAKPANAQSFIAASEKAPLQLQSALTELAQTSDNIANEKIPQLRAIAELEAEVQTQRTKLDQLRRLRDSSASEVSSMQQHVESIQTQNKYSILQLDEFVRAFETRIDYSETQLYTTATEAARLVLDDPEMGQVDHFQRQLDVMGIAIERLGKLNGGYRFAGLALAPSGDIERGNFAVFGPSVYFASQQSELTGVTFNQLNAAEAAIAVPGQQFSRGIRDFIENKDGRLPLDPTLGKALKMAASKDSWLKHLSKGGSVGTVILVLGLICLLLVSFKIWEIACFKTPKPEQVQQLLTLIECGELTQAKTEAQALPGAAGRLLQAGVTHYNEKHGTLDEILYEKILVVRPRLERFLPFIALTAAAAPLLGLLGTVTGMIKTFQLITIFGSSDATSLSSGISEALVTTELGLLVAIPALISHGLLNRLTRKRLAEMEQAAVGFINGVTVSRQSNSIA